MVFGSQIFQSCQIPRKKKTINPRQFQGTRETEAESLLIKISEGTMLETSIDNSEGAAEVVSEEEGNMVSMWS